MRDNHIVYATDHNFVFICAVSVASLVKQKKDNDRVIVHILTDDTLIEEDIGLFKKLENEYKNTDIIIHNIVDDIIESVDMSNAYLNKMTFYRLLIPTVLHDVDKCVYLDADTLVFDNLISLMKYDIDNQYLAVVKDEGIKRVPYNNIGNFDLDNYFNAGVMLMNLERIRKYNLKELFFSLIDIEWPFRDQDILNKTCAGEVLFLDKKFNQFSYSIKPEDKPVVAHFLGDAGMRPWQYLTANKGKEWWQMAEIFFEFDVYKNTWKDVLRRYNCSKISYLVEKCADYNHVYIFGSGFYGNKLVRGLKNNNVNNIIGVLDNSEALCGKLLVGVPVISPYEVNYDNENLYIITVRNKNAREEIINQLTSLGANMHQIIYYEEKSPEEYFYMSPEYQAEERENVLLRELGSGTARLGWDYNRLR